MKDFSLYRISEVFSQIFWVFWKYDFDEEAEGGRILVLMTADGSRDDGGW